MPTNNNGNNNSNENNNNTDDDKGNNHSDDDINHHISKNGALAFQKLEFCNHGTTRCGEECRRPPPGGGALGGRFASANVIC